MGKVTKLGYIPNPTRIQSLITLRELAKRKKSQNLVVPKSDNACKKGLQAVSDISENFKTNPIASIRVNDLTCCSTFGITRIPTRDGRNVNFLRVRRKSILPWRVKEREVISSRWSGGEEIYWTTGRIVGD